MTIGRQIRSCLKFRTDPTFKFIHSLVMTHGRAFNRRDNTGSKKRLASTSEAKLRIIKRVEKGETLTNISRTLGYGRRKVSDLFL